MAKHVNTFTIPKEDSSRDTLPNAELYRKTNSQPMTRKLEDSDCLDMKLE